MDYYADNSWNVKNSNNRDSFSSGFSNSVGRPSSYDDYEPFPSLPSRTNSNSMSGKPAFPPNGSSSQEKGIFDSAKSLFSSGRNKRSDDSSFSVPNTNQYEQFPSWPGEANGSTDDRSYNTQNFMDDFPSLSGIDREVSSFPSSSSTNNAGMTNSAQRKNASLFRPRSGNKSRASNEAQTIYPSTNVNEFPSLSGNGSGMSSFSSANSNSANRSNAPTSNFSTRAANASERIKNSLFPSRSGDSRSDRDETIYPSNSVNDFPSLSGSDSGRSPFSSTTSYDTGRSNTAQSNGTGQKRNSIFSSRSRNNSNSRSNDNSQTIYPSTNANAFPSLSGNGS
eukprot:12437353-Ditylum_brightwellii.AAC.1